MLCCLLGYSESFVTWDAIRWRSDCAESVVKTGCAESVSLLSDRIWKLFSHAFVVNALHLAIWAVPNVDIIAKRWNSKASMRQSNWEKMLKRGSTLTFKEWEIGQQRAGEGRARHPTVWGRSGSEHLEHLPDPKAVVKGWGPFVVSVWNLGINQVNNRIQSFDDSSALRLCPASKEAQQCISEMHNPSGR